MKIESGHIVVIILLGLLIFQAIQMRQKEKLIDRMNRERVEVINKQFEQTQKKIDELTDVANANAQKADSALNNYHKLIKDGQNIRIVFDAHFLPSGSTWADIDSAITLYLSRSINRQSLAE